MSIPTNIKSHTVFISHGGGPMPLLGDPGHQELVDHLSNLAQQLPKPEAIVVFSAHWEGESIEITNHAKPDLVYDYYGFPPESYEITYPVDGHPTLAQTMLELFQQHSLPATLTTDRGLDHGVFVPLKVMYPKADIPCVQVSLLKSLDTNAHLKMGNALQRLQGQNILFIGSGFSFHNMSAFFETPNKQSHLANIEFETWLHETFSDANLSEEERTSRISHWEQAPSARFCHPREEHLIPLFICYGLNEKPCSKVESMTILNKRASTFIW